MGASVDVEGEYGVTQKGIVVDYTPGAISASILLLSASTPSSHPLKSIRNTPEVFLIKMRNL